LLWVKHFDKKPRPCALFNGLAGVAYAFLHRRVNAYQLALHYKADVLKHKVYVYWLFALRY
jgi:hypothetical protein